MKKIIFWKLGIALLLTVYAAYGVFSTPVDRETAADREVRDLNTQITALQPDDPKRADLEAKLEQAKERQSETSPAFIRKRAAELQKRAASLSADEKVELARLEKQLPKWYERFKLGLDLLGGTEVRLRLRPDDRKVRQLQKEVGALEAEGQLGTSDGQQKLEDLKNERTAIKQNIQDAADVIRARLNARGLSEIPVTLQGNDKVLVQLPGMDSDDAARVIRTIQATGRLEFRLVVDAQSRGANASLLEKVRMMDLAPNTKNISAAQGRPLEEDEIDHLTGRGRKFQDQLYDWLRTPSRTTDEGVVVPGQDLLVEQTVRLAGDRIRSARIASSPDNPAFSEVLIRFDTIGGTMMEQLTARNFDKQSQKGRRLAIVLDGRLMSAPEIRAVIPASSETRITGDFTFKDAEDLVTVLKSGSLKVTIEKEFENTVGPTLGEDSIRQSMRAMLYGLVAVVAFMLLYYWVAGAVTDAILVMNMLLIGWVLVGAGATLTLPGIAGLILTIGMAVDANVLIFERIREEREKGNSLPRSIALGYERAFVTILDANLTTFITALILHSVGTEAVKGFAVTLMIGIISSMICSLVFTRWVFEALVEFKVIADLKMARFFKRPSINFIGMRRPAMVLSLVCIIAGMGLFISRGDLNYGHDFTGGTLAHISLKEPMPIAQARTAVDSVIGKEFTDIGLQSFGEDAGKGFTDFVLRTKLVKPQDLKKETEGASTQKFSAAQFKTAIRNAFPQLKEEGLKIDNEAAAAWSDPKADAFLIHASLKQATNAAALQTLLQKNTTFSMVHVLPAGSATPELPKSAKAFVSFNVDRIGESGTTAQPDEQQYDKAVKAAIATQTQDLLDVNTGIGALVLRPDSAAPADKKGISTELTLKRPASEAELRELLAAVFTGVELRLDNPSQLPAPSTDTATGFTILCKLPKQGADGTERGAEAQEQFVRNQFKDLRDNGVLDFTDPFPRFTSVGPMVATEMQSKAIMALLCAMVVIFFYIWLRFQFRVAFGAGAVLALLHDVLFTLGALAIADHLGLIDGQIDLTIVAALLTLVGYSLNDTIVVFDRIRENLHHGSRALDDVINESVNQTISRTIITSVTTLLVVLSLLLWGGGVIAGFAFTLFIGVLVGTYSSIFIASPVVIELAHWYAARQAAKRESK